TMGIPVSRDELQPGDLVFYYSPVSHVAIYVGDGQIIHASTFGVPVSLDPVDPWGAYNSARRITG
ncbi:MAG: C40 family peptidase, partial [Geodermatophilaceae bacterium]|nr:C40 family peptidase [Geodermatophilaceae bacterium]